MLGILDLGVLLRPLPFSLWKTKKAESLAALVGQGLLWGAQAAPKCSRESPGEEGSLWMSLEG